MAGAVEGDAGEIFVGGEHSWATMGSLGQRISPWCPQLVHVFMAISSSAHGMMVDDFSSDG